MNLSEILNMLEAKVEFTYYNGKYSAEILDLLSYKESEKHWVTVPKVIDDTMFRAMNTIITKMQGKRIKFKDSTIKLPERITQDIIITSYTGRRTTPGGTQF